MMVEGHRILHRMWRTGCILSYNNCQALLSSYQDRITIIVVGENKKKREFMAIVRSLIDSTN